MWRLLTVFIVSRLCLLIPPLLLPIYRGKNFLQIHNCKALLKQGFATILTWVLPAYVSRRPKLFLSRPGFLICLPLTLARKVRLARQSMVTQPKVTIWQFQRVGRLTYLVNLPMPNVRLVLYWNRMKLTGKPCRRNL